ncbi:DUF2064 domain-containing protein [Shewanella sp. 202IG2-18]|uniref:DUF2064 domain-containing protein n=1 Tax=Parashewanella hymeniacidonis TaxID=2807618 RepID=UPI001961B896|nr:DUF2064 domain-containing protein [Parashewanella hymeniacidonis]MBM7073114.1 DUF2064 domain-containing protein [Parashewanella hymeniacidonis]
MKAPLPTLVIFCKRPKLHQGKQRLTEGTTPENALKVAHALLVCAIEDAQAWTGNVVFACAHHEDKQWMKSQMPSAMVMSQLPNGISGNLGQRLNYIDSELRKLGHKQLTFIGTDAPILNQVHYQSVLTELQSNDIALSHADDGGVVIMANNTPWPNIKDLAWSTYSLGSELKQTCKQQQLTVATAVAGYDVDYVTDLKKSIDDLDGDNRPARRALVKLINNLFHFSGETQDD